MRKIFGVWLQWFLLVNRCFHFLPGRRELAYLSTTRSHGGKCKELIYTCSFILSACVALGAALEARLEYLGGWKKSCGQSSYQPLGGNVVWKMKTDCLHCISHNFPWAETFGLDCRIFNEFWVVAADSYTSAGACCCTFYGENHTFPDATKRLGIIYSHNSTCTCSKVRIPPKFNPLPDFAMDVGSFWGLPVVDADLLLYQVCASLGVSLVEVHIQSVRSKCYLGTC